MIRPIDPDDFLIGRTGDPLLHRNLAWYAIEGDAVIGVVILDLVDRDFSWVMLGLTDQGPGYYAIDLAASLPSREAATEALHATMMSTRSQ